jgi:hypothetical protein
MNAVNPKSWGACEVCHQKPITSMRVGENLGWAGPRFGATDLAPNIAASVRTKVLL